MAVARIVDAVERDRRGEPEQDVDDRHARHARVEKLRVSETPPHVPRRAVRRADLADYVAGLMAEAAVPADSLEAWALPPCERAQRRTDFSGQTVVVVDRGATSHNSSPHQPPPRAARPQGFPLWPYPA